MAFSSEMNADIRRAIEDVAQAIEDNTPTLRDQFAMAALTRIPFGKFEIQEERAQKAYAQADAMLAVREEGEGS